MAEPSATAEPSVIRTPLAFRVFMVVYLCGWCGAAVAFSPTHHGLPALAFLVLIVSFGAFVGYRLVRVSVTCSEDCLLARNMFRTHRVARADIEGFRIGRKVHQARMFIYARLRDGTVLPLDGGGQVLYFGRGTPLEDQLRMLRTWLAGSAPT